MMTSRQWQNGPAVPLTTPFLSTEGNPVDHAALAKQVVRCAKAGLGIVLLGTTGEGQPWPIHSSVHDVLIPDQRVTYPTRNARNVSVQPAKLSMRMVWNQPRFVLALGVSLPIQE